ncbi:HDOD domain-containing protein [Luteimonas sp. RIT-PG2_3]
MHLVVAWEHDDEIAALQADIARDGLDWQVTWMPLGDAATGSAADLEPDVFICDADSGWSRCQWLLDQVRQRQPHAIRIALMEPGDNRRAVAALEHAHRVLPKPMTSHEVVDAIQSVLDLQVLLSDPALKAALERVGALPSAPTQYLALTRLLRDPDVAAPAISDVIAQDPALTARVLRLSNSAYYATGREIGDLRTAVVRLGNDTLRRLVLACEVFSSGAEAEAMRDRALRISWLAAQLLPGSGSGLAATAGLLSEVGLLMPPEVRSADVPHGIAGAYLLGMWGLPEPIVAAVAYHAAPGRAPGAFWLAGAVHVAAGLVNGTEVDTEYLRRTGRLQELQHWRALAAGEPG